MTNAIVSVFDRGAAPEVCIHAFECDRDMTADELREELSRIARGEQERIANDDPPLAWCEFFDELYSEALCGDGRIVDALSARGIRLADGGLADWSEVWGEAPAL